MMAASDWTKRPADIADGELVSDQLVTCNYLSRLQSLAANLELSPDPDGDDRRDLSTIDVSIPWLPAGMPRFSTLRPLHLVQRHEDSQQRPPPARRISG